VTSLHRRLRSGLAFLAATAALCLASTPFAAAAYEPAGPGTTRLVLAESFVTLLQGKGVRLGVADGATSQKRVLAFPVSGGKVDPNSSRGTVLHGGAVTLSRGYRRFQIEDLMVKTTRRHSPLTAKVGGGQIKLFTAHALTVERHGFGVSIRSLDLRMTAKLAVRLNHKLGLNRVFAAGMRVGLAATSVDPALATVARRGRVSLELDPGLLAKLQGLFVAVTPIHPAEHPGAFTFPIAGGQLSPQVSAGVVEQEGALELLQLGGGQLFWREPRIDLDSSSLAMEVDLEPAPPYRGKIGLAAVASLDLSAATIASNPSRRALELGGARLVLSAEAAAELNEVFATGKPVFSAGEALGTVSFVAEAD
jgi:hypothetical protein